MDWWEDIQRTYKIDSIYAFSGKISYRDKQDPVAY